LTKDQNRHCKNSQHQELVKLNNQQNAQEDARMVATEALNGERMIVDEDIGQLEPVIDCNQDPSGENSEADRQRD
jgi:hypothetical protein